MTLTAVLTLQPQLTAASTAVSMDEQRRQVLPVEAQISHDYMTPTTTPMRLRKRQSNWFEMYEREMHSKEMEWSNPCGGVWSGDRIHKRTPAKTVLRMLQHNTGREHKTLKLATPAIDISDIRIWSLYKEMYHFLPTLKLNSNVALRRWHRHLQIYVASFSYLRRAQLYWDYHKSLYESEIAKELRTLKQSARLILCEVETAINNTTPAAAYNNHSKQSSKHRSRLVVISRATIEKRLKFQTPLQHVSIINTATAARLHDANPIDLKFTKFRYFSFLRVMVKILRVNTRRTGQMTLDNALPSTSSSLSSALSQHHNMHENKMKNNSTKPSSKGRRNRQHQRHRTSMQQKGTVQ